MYYEDQHHLHCNIIQNSRDVKLILMMRLNQLKMLFKKKILLKLLKIKYLLDHHHKKVKIRLKLFVKQKIINPQ